MTRPSTDRAKRKQKALEDCFCLLVSLALSEPLITPKQSRLIGRLIGRLKPYMKK